MFIKKGLQPSLPPPAGTMIFSRPKGALDLILASRNTKMGLATIYYTKNLEAFAAQNQKEEKIQKAAKIDSNHKEREDLSDSPE